VENVRLLTVRETLPVANGRTREVSLGPVVFGETSRAQRSRTLVRTFYYSFLDQWLDNGRSTVSFEIRDGYVLSNRFRSTDGIIIIVVVWLTVSKNLGRLNPAFRIRALPGCSAVNADG